MSSKSNGSAAAKAAPRDDGAAKSAAAARARRLTILPSGDAIRAADVRAVRIYKDETVSPIERPLYAVRALLEGGEALELAVRVSFEEAKHIARAAANAINKGLNDI